MKDYYEILEVHPKASSEIIKRAYKVLAARYHPDTCKDEDKEFSARKIRDINEAYSVLGDEKKRIEYDYFYFNQSYSGCRNYQDYKERKKPKNESNYSENKFSETKVKSENSTKTASNVSKGILSGVSWIVKILGFVMLAICGFGLLMSLTVMTSGWSFLVWLWYALIFFIVIVGIFHGW